MVADRVVSPIRLSRSCVGDEEVAALTRVIQAGFLGMGSEVQSFEQEIKAYLATPHEVICVNTGTAALHLALEGLDIGVGHEVLVPSITYLASFQAIAASGATPVACDVTPERVFIDLQDAERRVTEKTKAIMPVHYASDSTEMSSVYEFAERHGIRVIEDAAHAFGCKRNEKKIGATGDVLCFSFDGIKNITAGEGGAVITGDLELARRIRDARLLGVEKDTEKRYTGQRSWVFDVHHQGYRYHMSNLMAAIGREQLKKIDRFSEHRRTAAICYREFLAGQSGVKLLTLSDDDIVPHIFVIRVTNGRRDAVMQAFRDAKIECGIHYQPNHLLAYFNQGYALPVSELLMSQLLSLPLHAMLTEQEQYRVVDVLKSSLEGSNA